MKDTSPRVDKLSSPDERYRLYIDESGDHVYRDTSTQHHRYLCLLGCWMSGKAYGLFHSSLESFKQTHIPHNPDEPVVLHREDIVNCRKGFWRLRDEQVREAFDAALLELLATTPFRMFGAVIDKSALKERYPSPAHPYHLGLGFMLQRYCGYLNYVNRCGDVMAESRGGKEDRLLKESYRYIYNRGVWMFKAESIQKALTSKELKVKPKSSNIAGLQLADLLAHTVRKAILTERGHGAYELSPFAARLWQTVRPKLNRHEGDGREWGYGMLLFPE